MTNRLKRLDLIDRVPEELWMEVPDIAQEAEIKTIPKKKKCKQTKWLCEEALQTAMKRRERQRRSGRLYPSERRFQRTARGDKRAFLRDQYKETEGNNRMGKTRDLFKKIRDTKGTFHAKMDTLKDRNGMDLTEAEEIKKRWQEYTEELYKRDPFNPDNHDGVITHLEPDSLECEVKWGLGSITTNKASGGDGIPIELSQILKDLGCESAALNMPANLVNSPVATGLEKVSFLSSQRKAMTKNAQTTAQLHSSHALAK